MTTSRPPILVLACGALAHEIIAVCKMNHWHHFEVQCLPADLHNRPNLIVPAVRAKMDRIGNQYQKVLLGYADCGTGGMLDDYVAEAKLSGLDIERLPGAHCYEFFSGAELFAQYEAEEIGTFYLTDFLLRHFERFIIMGLGIDKHPELMPLYFGNYKRLLYLAQVLTPERLVQGRAAADRLGLAFDYRVTEYGDLETGLKQVSQAIPEKVINWQN
jgi:Protein of unknown function (DUF1638)